MVREKQEKEQGGLREYLNIFKHWTSLVALVPSVLIGILLHFESEAGILCSIFLPIILMITNIVAVSIPRYCITKLQSIEKDVTDKFSLIVNELVKKIDKCPKMAALHTDNNQFKESIRLIDDIDSDKSHLRWVVARYLSEILSHTFDDSRSFEIEAIDYSRLSGDLFRECKVSIHLTGSMHPIAWLNNVIEKNEKQEDNRMNRFLNNEIEVDALFYDENHHFYDKNNHSIILKEDCKKIKRIRYVCLENFDMEHFFVSEKSIDAYFLFNNGDIKAGDISYSTYFFDKATWDWYIHEHSGEYSSIHPMEFEYALYDDEVLLKWNKTSKRLTLVDKKTCESELTEIKKYFNEKNIEIFKMLSYKEIKKNIYKQKLDYVKNITQDKDNISISHKFSYLYNGAKNWNKIVKNKDSDYSEKGTTALEIASAIDETLSEFIHLMKSSNDFSIVEIGPGNGCRISTICDCFGSKNIKEYTLVDISRDLLDMARIELNARLQSNDEDKQIIKKYLQLDCCTQHQDDHEKNIRTIVEGKCVLILLNSTLFTEKGFDFKNLKEADSVYILLSNYDGNAEKSFEQYLIGQSLFLQPLRILEVPIAVETLKIFKKYLFTYEYEEPYFNIYFNLKLYINILRREDCAKIKEYLYEHIEDFVNTYERFIDDEKEPIKIIDPKEIETTELLRNKYINMRNRLLDNTKIKVLSSLKFKDEEGVKKYFSKNKVAEVFNVTVKKSGNGKFMGIYLYHRHT
jgi:hypothetical protein